MNETMKKLEPYFAYIIIGFLAFLMLLLMLFWPKKEFPVRPGQVWECKIEVIPFIDNISRPEVLKTNRDSVYNISKDGIIYYIENGTDSMEANLETFIFKSKLLKDLK